MSLGDRGFSLLELLVAMTLLSLVGVLSIGAIGFGQAAWDRASDRGTEMTESRVVRKFLDRQISAARVVRVRDGSREPPVLFAGSPDRVQLAAPVAAALAHPAPHLVEIAHVNGALVLRTTEIGETRPELSPTAPTEHLMQAKLVTFSYFGPRPEDGIPDWQASWLGRNSLPSMLSIKIDDAPTLVVRLRDAL